MDINSDDREKNYEIYCEYLKLAEEAQKSQKKEVMRRYLPLMLIPMGLCLAAFLCWNSRSGYSDYRTAVWLLFLGVLASYGVGIWGMWFSGKLNKTIANRIGRTKPGFEEFYRLYRKKQWPERVPLSDQAYGKFLALLGQKSPGSDYTQS